MCAGAVGAVCQPGIVFEKCTKSIGGSEQSVEFSVLSDEKNFIMSVLNGFLK